MSKDTGGAGLPSSSDRPHHGAVRHISLVLTEQRDLSPVNAFSPPGGICPARRPVDAVIDDTDPTAPEAEEGEKMHRPTGPLDKPRHPQPDLSAR